VTLKIPLKRSYGLILGFLLAAGFLLLAYGSVLSQFFWDEDDFVYVSSAVGHSDPGYIFQRQFNVQEFPRPVTHLYFWLVSRLAGPAAWPYLLSNLLLYALSTVLLFKVVKKLTGNEYASIAVALLYLISPCATSNLFWVAAGATGYVSATLMLAALSLYLRSDFDVNPKVRIVAWAVALLAMGAKESALSLPLLMLMMDLTLARRRQGWFRRVLPFFIIAGLLALNVITVQLS